MFDRSIFESIIDKVVVGGVDNDGIKDSSMLTFIYRTSFTNSIDGGTYKPQRKGSKEKSNANELCSDTSNEANNLCSHHSTAEGSTSIMNYLTGEGERKFNEKLDVFIDWHIRNVQK